MVNKIDRPDYKNVIQFYLQPEVLEYFYKLSQSRQLKFFHHCDTDPRSKSIRPKPKSIDIHCPASIDELRNKIIKVADPVPEYDYEFYPFWGIQSPVVNHPGQPNNIIGWDMRFEFDFDLWESFAVLIPVAAILRAYNIPIILKYSGHRSLHLIIPAESFPLSLKENPSHQEWMEVFDKLGFIFYRIAPYVTSTHTGLAKDFIISAPYSLHRYFGLVGIPLEFNQLFSFDQSTAGMHSEFIILYPFPDSEFNGFGMNALLKLAEEVVQDDSKLLDIAKHSFRDIDLWRNFINRINPDDMRDNSLLSMIMAGPISINVLNQISHTNHHQQIAHLDKHTIRLALLAIDHPLTKTNKFSGLVHTDFGWHQPMSNYIEQRRIRAELLAIWVEDGIEGAVDHLQVIASDDEFASPILLATRLLDIIPEPEEVIIISLLSSWKSRDEDNLVPTIFLGLSLAERCRKDQSILQFITKHPSESRWSEYQKMLMQEEDWQSESRPDQALQTLILIFGEEKITYWLSNPKSDESQLIIKNIFSNKKGKFLYAANKIFRANDK